MRLLFTTALLLLCLGGARGFELVSAEEALRPDAPDTLILRGITRGPTINQLQPAPQAKPLKSPFKLKLNFKAHGGGNIDGRSVEVFYVKEPDINITERVKTGISPQGLDLDEVKLPPGLHRVKVRVADEDGRVTELVLKLDVEQ
jgi:hypothetical protein